MERDGEPAWRERLEVMRRSVAMLSPGAPAMDREEAMKLLDALAAIRDDLDQLRIEVARLVGQRRRRP